MKIRLKNAWKELRGNRGSGVLLVMVAIACITLMTTSLLHLTYTGFKIKASERQSRVDFYAAEAKMDELLAAIQNDVSTVIADAQKLALVSYDTSTSTDQPTVSANNNTVLQTEFADQIEQMFGISGGVYNAPALKTTYFSGDDTVKIINDSTCTAVWKDTEKQWVLQNVRLNYTSEKSGNTTIVDADIVITAPKFIYAKVGTGILNDDSEWNIEEIVKFENWSTY